MAEIVPATLRVGDMAPQEVFDYATAFLRKQKVASISPGIACRYRGFKNTACGVGCFIPDVFYRPGMEGRGLATLLISPSFGDKLNELGFGFSKHAELLMDLQQAHDGYMPRKMHSTTLGVWEWARQKVAAKHKLAYTPNPEAPAELS